MSTTALYFLVSISLSAHASNPANPICWQPIMVCREHLRRHLSLCLPSLLLSSCALSPSPPSLSLSICFSESSLSLSLLPGLSLSLFFLSSLSNSLTYAKGSRACRMREDHRYDETEGAEKIGYFYTHAYFQAGNHLLQRGRKFGIM